MNEEWVEVDGYPTYAVSSLGRVVNLTRDTLLKPRPNGAGYLRVTLVNEDGQKDHYIHRLVAQAFNAGYDPRSQVIHWNADHEDNRADNLRMKRRAPRRLASSNRQIIGRRVAVVETGDVFRTARDCANHIGGDYSSVYAVLRGERRTHRGYTFQYYEEGQEAA